MVSKFYLFSHPSIKMSQIFLNLLNKQNGTFATFATFVLNSDLGYCWIKWFVLGLDKLHRPWSLWMLFCQGMASGGESTGKPTEKNTSEQSRTVKRDLEYSQQVEEYNVCCTFISDSYSRQ